MMTDSKAERWYLDIMSPNTKGEKFAWLDPTSIYINGDAFTQLLDDLTAELDGVECHAADGAFYAFPSFEAVIDALPNVRDDVELAEWLLEHAGVALVPGTAFGAPGFLRMSFASDLDTLETGIARIRRALDRMR